MKKLIIIFIVAVFASNVSAQISFEAGYFINESDEKIDCLIKNVDWRNNPTEFQYKLAQGEEVEKTTIETVKEFGINTSSKYIRAKIKMDRSSNTLTELSSERHPSFEEEVLFLKVLIQGHASLFEFTEGNLTRFFYQLMGSDINQLVYKKYLYQNKILENNAYKQLLFLELACDGVSSVNMDRLEYRRKALEQLFIYYNQCAGHSFVNYNVKEQKAQIHLSLRPGLNHSSYVMNGQSITVDFGNYNGFRLGIEAEFILPFHKNKWGLIFEPNYQYYKRETSQEVSWVGSGDIQSSVNYKSIDLPVGVRHYIYLNENSKLFANAYYQINFTYMSPNIRIDDERGNALWEFEVKSRGNMAVGVGYKFRDRCSLEIQYHTSREILSNRTSWQSEYNKVSVITGFTLF